MFLTLGFILYVLISGFALLILAIKYLDLEGQSILLLSVISISFGFILIPAIILALLIQKIMLD